MYMCAVIYVIKNNLNNKVYVGQTIQNPNKRWQSHLKTAKKKDKKNFSAIHAAIDKYGKENFSFIIQEENIEKDKLNEREIFWVNEYKSYNKLYGYNCTLGGDGVVLTPEKEIIRSENVSKRMIELRNNGMLYNSKIRIENVLEIKNKIMSGEYTHRQLAAEYNCSAQTIGQIQQNKIFKDILKDTPVLEHGKDGWYHPGYKNRGGINNNSVKLKQEDLDLIVKMKAEGYKIKDIAEKFNTTRQVITRWIKRLAKLKQE